MCEVNPTKRRPERAQHDKAEGVYVPRSERRIVLMCEECGERTVLAGPESIWREARTFFECGCGKDLTLADRLGEQDTAPLASPQAHAGGNR